MATLDGVARWHRQTSYTGLKKSLQQEWSFVQCFTPYIGMAFQAVEDELHDTFLPDIFQGGTSQIPGRAITGMLSKQAGIALPDPNQTAGSNWTESCEITGHLVTALHGTAKFSSDDHALLCWKIYFHGKR